MDVLLTPVSLGPPPSHRAMEDLGPVESSVHDTFTVPVNLAGNEIILYAACTHFKTFIIMLNRLGWFIIESKHCIALMCACMYCITCAKYNTLIDSVLYAFSQCHINFHAKLYGSHLSIHKNFRLQKLEL